MALPDLSTFVLLASLFLGPAPPPQDAAQEAPPVRMVEAGRLVDSFTPHRADFLA